MPELTPDQAAFLLHGVYLPGLRNEHSITMSIIKAIPADKGDYHPDGISRSAMDLAWHVAAAEMRFMDSVIAGQFDLSPRPRPDSVKHSGDLAVWYGQNFGERLDKLTALSNDQLIKIIDFRGIMQLPAVMLLDLSMHHSIHHRGQLSMYLRPMGAKVPAIYGESFDTAQARKAAQGA
jgi:uncharacterized damage-inducible protein DinB